LNSSGLAIWAVNDANGHLMVNGNYLNNGDKTDLYLDIVHELYHVKQFMDGRELFDRRYDYVDRPTKLKLTATPCWKQNASDSATREF